MATFTTAAEARAHMNTLPFGSPEWKAAQKEYLRLRGEAWGGDTYTAPTARTTITPSPYMPQAPASTNRGIGARGGVNTAGLHGDLRNMPSRA